MDYGLFGNKSSGAWRYPGSPLGTSNDAIAQPVKIDEEFLKKIAGNKPTGLLDQITQAKPLDQAMGLIPQDTGQQGQQSAGQMAQPGHEATSQWGTNRFGYDVNINPAGAAKGMLGMGPLGSLLGGVSVSQDPLGQFAYQQLLAQENRDLSSGMTNYGVSPTANGPTTEAQAQALADQLSRSLAGYESGGGGYSDGYSSNSAGGSPDGYW